MRWALAIAATLGLFGCAQTHHPLPIRASTGPIEDASVFDRVLRRVVAGEARPAASSDGLWPDYATEQSRRQLALTIWTLVEQRYYDPALNGASWAQAKALDVELAAHAQSDAAFYAALKRMLGRLGDSHSQVLTPVESAQFHQFAGPTVGLHFRQLDGRLVVADVELDSPAARSGVRPGDVLRAVGLPGAIQRIDAPFFEQARRLAASEPMVGIYKDPALRALMALLRPLLSLGVDGSEAPGIFFEFERFADASQAARADAAGQLLPLTLSPERAVRPAQAQLRWLEGDIAWLTFNRFAPELQPWLEDALDAAAKAQGIVVDLRGNGGGVIDQYLWFTGQFLDREEFAVRRLERSRHRPAVQVERPLRAGPGGSKQRAALMQPLMVLIDEYTASAAELAAVTLRELRNAPLVGEASCGCVVAVPHEYVLPDGGGIRVAETGFRSMQGRRLEGEPTAPDVVVRPSLDDLIAQRDPVLAFAHQRLRKRLRAGIESAKFMD